jgi:hypothetical protein
VINGVSNIEKSSIEDLGGCFGRKQRKRCSSQGNCDRQLAHPVIIEHFAFSFDQTSSAISNKTLY